MIDYFDYHSRNLEIHVGYVHVLVGASSNLYHDDCGFSKMRYHLSITLAGQPVLQQV